MKFNKGDKVEHTNLGNGIFVSYENEDKTEYYDFAIVEFDKDSYDSGVQKVII